MVWEMFNLNFILTFAMIQVSLFMISNLEFPATEVKLSSLSAVFYTRLYHIALLLTVLLLEKK